MIKCQRMNKCRWLSGSVPCGKSHFQPGAAATEARMSFFLKWKLLQYFGHWKVSSVTGGGGASAKFRSSNRSIAIHLVRLYRAAKQVLDPELLFVWLDLTCPTTILINLTQVRNLLCHPK